MLRALRNQTKSIFFKCFLVLLICGFALWGVGDLTGGYKGKTILSVNNQHVTVEEVLDEMNRTRYLLPERPSLQDAIKNGIHKSILNKFEQELLINAEAKNLNLNVPLSEKMRLIQEEGAFKDPLGKFSQKKFTQSLINAGLSETKYLEMIEINSYFKQLSMPFMMNDLYNKKIITKMMDWQKEIRDVEFQSFKFIDKSEILKPSNEILKLYYQDNKKEYEFPITRNINYIEISPTFFEDQVLINEKMIDEKYEIEKSNYDIEETRELYQIVIQDENKANEFIELIKQGRNFDKIAKENFNLQSSDINVGYLKRSDLPKESSERVFKAKLNETLGPIKTKFGFNIYKIINISPQKQINYETAIIEIKKKLVKELSLDILFEKLDIIEDLIAEGNTIEEIVQSNVFNKNILVRNLKNISKNGLVYSYVNDTNFLNKNEQFLKNIWNTGINELSEIFNSNDDKFYLIEVIKENKKVTPTYDLIKDKIYKKWFEKEVIIKSKEKAKSILLANKNKLSSKKSIKRSDKSFSNINDQFLINKIFEIKNKKVNLIVSQNNLLAVKVIKSRTENYNFDKNNYNQLNKNFSKSFFNDFSNKYVQNLAVKHKLEKNYQELENFFVKSENLN